jgi:hypothetical protein
MSFFFVFFIFPGSARPFSSPYISLSLCCTMMMMMMMDDPGVSFSSSFCSYQNAIFISGSAWLGGCCCCCPRVPPFSKASPHQKSSATERTLQRNITHTQSAPPFGAAAPHPFLDRTANPFLSFS